MPWNKKTKAASDWKPVRVRKAWLDLMRARGERESAIRYHHRPNYRKRTEDAAIRVSGSVMLYTGFLLGRAPTATGHDY